LRPAFSFWSDFPSVARREKEIELIAAKGCCLGHFGVADERSRRPGQQTICIKIGCSGAC
jgi:hypothetical protein